MKNAEFIFNNIKKGSKIELFNDTFEVYNTTIGAAHAVKLNAKGERMTANKNNLTTFNLRMIELGIQTGKLVVL